MPKLCTMPKRSSKGRLYLNQLAKSIVDQATGEAMLLPIDEKKKSAQESGQKGGLIGGVIRASKLSPDERSKIAKNAAKARWAKN